MSDVNAVINHVRASRGLDPLPDPHHIEGFGPGFPPPPSMPMLPAPSHVAEDPYGLNDDSDEVPVSPLIPTQALKRQKADEAPEPTFVGEAKLIVLDAKASCEGMAVQLSDKEERAVKQIVLRAVERTVRDRLKAVQAQIPKREYRKVAKKKQRKGAA